MPHPVFISYARDASREHARALHQALGGRTAFLDTEAIPLGERFPEALVDALFDAQVVVIFAEPTYFTRWYCLLEFRMARTPFLRTLERPDATAKEKEDALRGLIVALPPRGVDPMMERFPPLVQGRNWPAVDDIDGIAKLVDLALAANPPTLRTRYASVAAADAARSYLLAATRLPPPLRIGAVPFVPQYGLPHSIADAFVGRADDLWRIHDLLWTERGDPATAAGLTGSIEAIGGFGKTRLALEYLYRFGPRHFKGGLFWINAESDAELQLYDVLQALNPQAPAIEQVRQIPGGVPAAVARAIRSRPDDAPTPLFIIDNVPEPEAGQQPRPLDTWCPVLSDVPVLTTSRTRVALGAGGVVALPIEKLDTGAAVALLTTGLPRDPLEDTEWNAIVEWVGHLPLALEVLNSLLRSGEMAPRALLDLSREERPSVAIDAAMESIRSGVPPGALRGITEAFSASYNLLTAEEQYAARLIAWMAPAPVPMFVIDEFGPDVFAAGVRSKLRNRSFVTEVRDGSGAFYGAMHRVLADFVRAQSHAPEEEIEAVASLLTGLLESAEGRGDEGSARVRECAPLASSTFANWISGSFNESGFDRASIFATYVGIALMRWGNQTLAGTLFGALASASGRWLGEKHPNTLGSINNLAVTQRERGDLTGVQELQERVLEDMQRVFGDEHPATFFAMNNLAITRRERGDHVGAQELQQRVLGLMRRILGDEHPDTFSAMNDLANTLQAQGDYAGAEELQECVLEARRRILGDEHPQTLTVMSNLAVTRHYRGESSSARALQERVLKVRRRILGNEHPDTLLAMNNLAVTHCERGDHARAQALQEQALEVTLRRLGTEHPLTTAAAWGLLQVYANREDVEAARRVFHEALIWLLNRDSASLTGQQRVIQAHLRKFADATDHSADQE